MRAEGKLKKGDFEPAVGGGLEIEYNPITTKLSLDYSSEDSLGVTLEGEYKLKWMGKEIEVGAELGLGKDTWNIGESLTLGISKNVSTTVSHELSSTDGNTFTASLKLTF
jgi:hypothetical protein